MRPIVCVLVLIAAFGFVSMQGVAQEQYGFEKLITLVGEWEAKGPDGKDVTISYELMSGGTSLMEILSESEDKNMVTIYHSDGDDLMMTHYCSMGNQPRMRAKVPGGDVREITFSFEDVTNLADPSAGHMHGLVVTFKDKNHFTQEWTMRKEGKEIPMTFAFARKK